MGAPGARFVPPKNAAPPGTAAPPGNAVQPLLDQLIVHTHDADARPDPAIEESFSSIQSTLSKIRGRVATVGYIDSKYGNLREDLESIDAGLTTLKKSLENYRKK